jgi:D-threo-aldose 1-dehydrogenase
MPNRAQQIFKPEFRFGLGGVSLGNEFNKHTDKDAEGTLEAAWEMGVRYFDVAPWYGFGLAERRFGHFLHNKKREDYLLSSKVGKLFKASKNNRHAEIYPLSDSPNDIVFDYTADGVRRSIEDSLQRLGVDSLDVAFVHDISPDFAGRASSAGCSRSSRPIKCGTASGISPTPKSRPTLMRISRASSS